MSDVDVVWRRDPRPYLLCRDEDADANGRVGRLQRYDGRGRRRLLR